MHNRFVPIKNFPDYLINNDGIIFSIKTKTFRRPKKSKSGHLEINLSHEGNIYWKLVHRLVLESFIGPCPDGMECCHNNGIPYDNRVSNLRWATRRENVIDAYKHGKGNWRV